MQPGSIVELTKKLTPVDISQLRGRRVSLSENTPYVIKSGPFRSLWELSSGEKVYKDAIILEEFSLIQFNANYFSEIQPPISAVEIAEMIGEEATCFV